MTKEDKIKEAYGNTWDSVKKYVDENGWFKMDFDQKDNFANSFVSCTYDMYQHNVPYGIRPKELDRIEDNNGWIRGNEPDIKNESYFVRLFGETFETLYDEQLGWLCGNSEHITHHQVIQKPQPPIY